MTPKRLREIIAEELAYRFAIDEGLWDDVSKVIEEVKQKPAEDDKTSGK